MSVPKIQIRLGVKSKIRDHTERYRPTRTYSETWVINTDSENYVPDIETPLDNIWTYTLSERSKLAEVGLHYSVTLENISADEPPAGAWVQAKGHLDGEIDPDGWPSIDVPKDKLYFTIDQLLKHAKY